MCTKLLNLSFSVYKISLPTSFLKLFLYLVTVMGWSCEPVYTFDIEIGSLVAWA